MTVIAASGLTGAASRGDEPESAASSVGQVAIALSADNARIEISGIPDSTLAALRQAELDQRQWSHILAVHVANGDAPTTLPVLGAHAVAGSVLTFTPSFPLRPGLKYLVVYDAGAVPGMAHALKRPVETVVAIAARPVEPHTKVVAVFPSGNELPENLLKLYIHFSAPMARGDAYRHVRIVDAKNREVPDAFLEIDEELWSPDSRRLTLLFDPGRIKRGLRPNQDVGSPLRAGRSYALVVDGDWRDADGAPLVAGLRKEFRVSAPDETQPDPRKWRIESPSAASREPLVIQFGEPLDRALAARMIAVRNPAGREVDGRTRVDREETRWRFFPAAPWQPGQHELLIDGTLEDRAGNSIGRLYEVADAGDEVGVTSATEVVLPVMIAAPK